MESLTEVINLHKTEADVRTVYIGRPSKWGNPYKSGVDGTRSEVIARYKQYVLNTPELLDSIHELEGKKLACWCHPKSCHGDVLVELVNANIINQHIED